MGDLSRVSFRQICDCVVFSAFALGLGFFFRKFPENGVGLSFLSLSYLMKEKLMEVEALRLIQCKGHVQTLLRSSGGG